MKKKRLETLAEIVPQVVNLNRHTQRGMGMLEKSISERGWIGAITAAADGEIFDGSARRETLESLGLEDAVIVRSDGSKPVVLIREDIPSADDPRAKLLALEANRIAQANLDFDPAIFASLSEEMDLSHLFYPDEMALILEGMGQEETQADDEESGPEIDESKPTRCQPGDVWRVGEHIVACLDSTDVGAHERVVKGKPGMVWADPPYGLDIVRPRGAEYNIPFGGKKGSTSGDRAPVSSIRHQSEVFDGVRRSGRAVPVARYAPIVGDEGVETAMAASALCLSQYPDAVQFWWGANNYAHVLPPSTCWIVWDKENTGDFADVELAWCSHKGAARLFRHMWNGLMKASEQGQARVHPTQKPVALCEWAFGKYGSAGDLILDPFLGSGPSLKAAHRMGDGRRVVGFELSPHYVDHILEWASAEGLTCSLAEGLTCERVEKQPMVTSNLS